MQPGSTTGTVTFSQNLDGVADEALLSGEVEDLPASFEAVEITGYIEHYEIVRLLGAGGMGRVFLARDTKLGRLVAIKLLHAGGRAASRLLAEAQATAQAIHENIVVIHAVGVFDGRPYMVLIKLY